MTVRWGPPEDCNGRALAGPAATGVKPGVVVVLGAPVLNGGGEEDKPGCLADAATFEPAEASRIAGMGDEARTEVGREYVLVQSTSLNRFVRTSFESFSRAASCTAAEGPDVGPVFNVGIAAGVLVVLLCLLGVHERRTFERPDSLVDLRCSAVPTWKQEQQTLAAVGGAEIGPASWWGVLRNHSKRVVVAAAPWKTRKMTMKLLMMKR